MSGTRQEPARFVPVSVHGKTQHEIFHVDERYTDLRIVGSGSYGVVCAATGPDGPVAIKKVTNALEDLVDAGRVLRELRLLRHIGGKENTLKIRECYTYPPDTPNFEDVYIVTDLLETDMDRVLRSKQGLSAQHFGYFLYQLLRSVANMHRASVLHRDLKPSNLLVNSNCDLVVCDFGLARGVSNTAKQPPNTARTDRNRQPIESVVDDGDTDDHLTEYVVTRWYRPPEILAESPYYGAAADIWSVGCIFGEMMDKKRRPIFRGSNPQNQMKLIVSALGCPTEAELDFCTSTSSRGVIRRVCGSVTNEHTLAWDFAERFPNNDPQAIDLLQKMLVFDPKKRITAEEALNHPFLAEVHSHWSGQSRIAKFDFSFEKVHHDCNRDRTIPKRHLQNLFLYEVQKYRRVLCHIPRPLHLKQAAPTTSTSSRRTGKKSSDKAQILELHHRTAHSKSNQQLEALDDNISTLPMIGCGVAQNTTSGSDTSSKLNGGKAASKKVLKKGKEKTSRGKVVVVNQKSVVPAAKLFRQVHPSTVVPASAIIKKEKLSQSLRPPPDNKTEAVRKKALKKKSASSSAILQRNSSGTTITQTTRQSRSNHKTSLFRRASKNLF